MLIHELPSRQSIVDDMPGNLLYSEPCSPTMRTVGLHFITLNSTAISDLQNRITSGLNWWALLFAENTENFIIGGSDDSGIIAGHDYEFGPEPWCTVSYCLPSSAPSGAYANPSSICIGDLTTLTKSSGSLGDGATWKWYAGSCGGTYIGSGNSISVSPTSTTTYYVRAEGICNNTACASVEVLVVPSLAQPGAITGQTSVCQGSSQTYSISPVSGATSYTWFLPSNWTVNGSSNLTAINVTVGANSGHISVTANNSCGSSTERSLNVSVTPTPAQPGSITGSTSVCQGSSQTYSISAITGATSYTWSLPSNWTANGSSNLTAINVTVGANSGHISVTANNSCGSSTERSLNVSVTPTPAQPGSITGSTSVCQGSSQTYSISAITGATSYTWSLPSNWTANGSSNLTAINVTVGANSGHISVTANNSCGSSTERSLNVSVTPTPAQPGSITGSTSVCQGSSLTYSISAVTGATSYTWSLPSNWTVNGSSNLTFINVMVGANSGHISVTANNSCGSSTERSLNVSVTPTPAQPGSITGSTSVCQGSAQTYSIGAVTGATSYTWTLPSGWSGSSTTTSITATAGANGGTISVTANNSCGSSTPRTLSVSVTAIPAQPGAITGSTSVCQGSSQTYSIGAVTGATSYTWTLPSGWSGSSTTTSITATVGANGGTISVTANNSCGSSTPHTLSVSVTAIPAQPGAITGSTSVCQGSSQTYSIGAVTGATSYTWILPSGWSGSSTTTSITATAGANGGTISVTANNSCGSSTPRTLSVSVTAIPAQPGAITGSTSVCQGSSRTYSIGAVTGATSYTWTLPSGWSGSSTTTSITATADANGGTISVTANNSCGSSTERSLSVSVTAIPAQPGSISGETNVIPGQSYTYSIASVTGAASYTWTLPSGWSGSSTTTSITATAGANGGTISVTANNSCGASTPSTLNVFTCTPPAQPGAITGLTSVCQNSSQTYTISEVAGASSYSWTLPSGWSGSSSSSTITTIAGVNGGTISVTANNSCGSSNQRTLNISVTAIPAQPGSISDETNVIPGQSYTYSIASVTGATSYTWTLPSGWSGSSTTTSITATAGANGGTISVTANNSCGSSNPRTLNVSTCTPPTQPGTITGSLSVCQGSSQTYSIGAVTGATSYTWTLPSGWSGSSTTTSITATAGANGGTASVTANNSCGSSTERSLSVSVTAIPAQPGDISGETNVTPDQSYTYSIASVSGATSYTWTLPSDWSGSSYSNSITATAGTSGGTISVTANNSCGASTPSTLNVFTCTPPAQPGAITGLTSVCQNSSQTYTISEVAGATSYSWTLPSGWSGSSSSSTITTIAGVNGGTISATANNSCGSSNQRTLNISVTAIPAQPDDISGETNVTPNQSYTYSIASVSGATSYTWTLPSGWSGSSYSNSITATAGTSGGTISVTANNSCGASTPSTLNVFTCIPIFQPCTIIGPTSVCQGSSQTYTIPELSNATSYSWTLPSGWSGNSSTTTSITVFFGSSDGTISVSAYNSCGSSTQCTLSISVTSIPAQPGDISGETNVTPDQSYTYSIASVSGATSYTWTLPSGWSGSSTSNSISATAGTSGGTISVTANNSCGASTPSTLNVFTCTPPAQPGTITGLTSVCQGLSQTYTISEVAGATSYSWTLPSGWSGSSSSSTITTIAGVNGGTISATANNSCGASNQRTLNISVTAIPSQPGDISGETNVTPGQSYTYSIASVSGATSYTWTLPTGWSGSSYSNSILTTAGSNGGTISVAADNTCGSSTPSTLNVRKEIICIAPQIIVKWNDVLICSNVDSMIINYQWYNGTSQIIGANKQYYVTSKLPGEYRVEIIDKNGCKVMSNEIKIAESKSLSIYPNPAKETFTISIKDEPLGKVNIRIINDIGTEVLCIESEKSDTEFLREIPTSILDEGLYVVQVLVGKVNLYNSKIIIIK